jgi:hypothetical protein
MLNKQRVCKQKKIEASEDTTALPEPLNNWQAALPN